MLVLYLFPLTGNEINAQNVQSFATAKPIDVSGSIGIGLGTYNAYGRDSRRDPFSYLLNANLNFKIYGINIPFSAVFSQQETNFLQPFNQYGLSPHWKWIKVHAGYRRMNFSPFTLSGHTFLGAGVELTPQISDKLSLRISGMYGRLRRAVEQNAQDSLNVALSYKRMGFAAKVGLGYGDDNYIDFILFKAKDDPNSIDISSATFNVQPQENLVLGISALHNISKRVTLLLDYGNSAFSRDIRNNEEEASSIASFYGGIGGLFTPRSSSNYSNAFRGEVKVQLDRFAFGGAYNRVDPDYRTLGAYFFLNDIEDYTFNLSGSAFKGTTNFSVNAGWQKNNLNKSKASQSSRFIASANLSFTDKRRFNLNISASNYSTFLKVVQEQFSDSTNVYQISRNISVNTDIVVVERKNPQSIWASASFQVGNFRDEYNINNQENTFFNSTIGYRYNWRRKKWTFNPSFNYSTNTAALMGAYNFGPSINVGKRFKNKSNRASYNASFLMTYNNDLHAYDIMNHRISYSMAIAKKHNVTFGIGYFMKMDKIIKDNSFAEMRGRVNYRYNF